MDLNDYQEAASATAHWEKVNAPLTVQTYAIMYCALGMGGEAGEAQEKVKKLMRDSGGVITPEIRESVKKELGDVLWYLGQLAKLCGLTLSEVAEGNLQKIMDRDRRGVRHGQGDDR